MARRSRLEILKDNIPQEFHSLLEDKANIEMITNLSKLDDSTLKIVYKSIPEVIKPVFKTRLDSKTSTITTRGAKSNLPYSKEEVAKAAKYMALKPGTAVRDSDGKDYSLNTVQILIKAHDGENTFTIALSKMQ